MRNKLAITIIENASPKAPLVLRGDLVQSVNKAAELGYGAIEIHVLDVKGFPVQAVTEACRLNGLSVSAIATGHYFIRHNLCITSADMANRNASMQEVYKFIDLAASLGTTDGIIIGWAKGTCPEQGQQAYYDLLAEQLNSLGIYATAKNQRILLEVINRYETNVFNTTSEIMAFLGKYNPENVWVHMDTFHMNIDEANMTESIRLAGSRLGYFHIADSNRFYPGAGHIDFVPIISALKEIGYSGALSVECIPSHDSETTARKSIIFLNSLINVKI
jgi:sugar phosphate isomerase/epimerase